MELGARQLQFFVEEGRTGLRLDHYLTQSIPGKSRSFLRKLLDQGLVTVNGKHVKAGYMVALGDQIQVEIPPVRTLSVEPEEIALDVIYEDADIIVINKPPGMVVHPAAGNLNGTLVNALLAHCTDLSGIGGIHRPGIVHRLDKDTSGVIVAAKTDAAHKALARQIKERTAERWYLALVHGNIGVGEGSIDAPIARHPVRRKQMAIVAKGRAARTHYIVRERFGDYTLVECHLETGRTHQIRVHMAHIGHPIVGDGVYGPKQNKLGMPRQALHAYHLGFIHPRTGDLLAFNGQLPEDMARILAILRYQIAARSKRGTVMGQPSQHGVDKAGMR